MRRVLRKVPADLILDPVVGQISQERMVCEMEESDAEDNAERVKTGAWGSVRMIIAALLGRQVPRSSLLGSVAAPY